MAKKITTSSASGSSGGNKKILWFAGAIVIGVGAWFGYNWWKKRQENTNGNNQQQNDNQTFQQDTPVVSQPNISQPTVSSLATNPFTNQDDLIKFQQWVINTKKDTTILGKGGSTGFGDDGKWGTKSANAWSKYGAEYQKGTNKPESNVKGLDSDTITVLVNTRNNGNRVAWGNKATENYIKSSKYPSFFNAWKDAVLRRIKEGGNTLFFWGGAYYDSYTGSYQVKGTLKGRGIKSGNNTYNYPEVNGSKGLKIPENKTIGQVDTWRYEFKDNLLWIKSTNNFWYKYPYIKLV